MMNLSLFHFKKATDAEHKSKSAANLPVKRPKIWIIKTTGPHKIINPMLIDRFVFSALALFISIY